jgi:hypothetical protein
MSTPTDAMALIADVVDNARVLGAAEALTPELSVNWAFAPLMRVNATALSR